jgi:hypothetical protein
MKRLIPILLFLFFGSFALGQKENKGKPQDTKITSNASGVKRSIGYRFSTVTEDKDPGSGIFRYNNKNVASVNYIFVDKNDIKGEDQTNWYQTWDDNTGATGRGQIVLVELNGENVNVFDVTDVFIDGNGYWKFPVKYVSGKLPVNDSVYYYVFNRIAHGGGPGDKEQGTIVEEVNKVEEPPAVEEVVTVAPVVEEAPAEVVVAEAPVVEAPVVEEAPAEVVVAEALVVEVPVIEEAPVVEVVTEAPVVVAPVIEEVPAEVVVGEAPVVKAPVIEEAPAEVVVAEAAEEKKVNESNAEKPVILSKKILKINRDTLVIQGTTVTEGPPKITETKPVQKPEEPTAAEVHPRITETKPDTKPVSTTVAQGPPRVTETRTERKTEGTTVTRDQPVESETRTESKPVSTTVAQGPPRVTETKTEETPAPQAPPKVTETKPAQETTVVQGTKTAPVTQPARETKVAEVPVTQNYNTSSSVGHGKCYRGIIEIGYALRISEYGMNNFRFNFINGFNIGHTSLGLGIGVRKYYDKPANHPDWLIVSSDVQIPVFLDVRATFSSRKITPYLGVGIGGSAGFDSDTTKNKSEGLYFHATGGIWFNLSDRFAIFGGFAYEMQRLEYANVFDEIPFKKYTNSISLNIGIAF